MKKEKIYNGKYITYKDEQSLEETHDMLVKALPGQSYVKEPLNKVSTTQVTGDALMKVAVGGKGGFAAGTAGDVREKKKDLQADLVRMEKKHVYQQHLSIDEKIVGWEKRVVPFTGHEDWIPIHEDTFRDYDDFTYQNELDASDYMRNAEFYYKKNQSIDINSIRKSYDEICGYKGAWQYVGLDGREHRRYRIYVTNTLNHDTKNSSNASGAMGNPMWTDESARANHHTKLYDALNKYWRDGEDEDFLKDWMVNSNNGHAGYVMWYLDQLKPEFYAPSNMMYVEPVREPSEDFLQAKAVAEEFERKRRLEALKKAPDLRDWKIVYKWELTKQGKIMFANEKV